MKVTTTPYPVFTSRVDIRSAELAFDRQSEYKPVHLFLNLIYINEAANLCQSIAPTYETLHVARVHCVGRDRSLCCASRDRRPRFCTIPRLSTEPSHPPPPLI